MLFSTFLIVFLDRYLSIHYSTLTIVAWFVLINTDILVKHVICYITTISGKPTPLIWGGLPPPRPPPAPLLTRIILIVFNMAKCFITIMYRKTILRTFLKKSARSPFSGRLPFSGLPFSGRFCPHFLLFFGFSHFSHNFFRYCFSQLFSGFV